MSHAAHAPQRRPRREVETWAEDLDILGGLGEGKHADWTVLTLEREPADEPGPDEPSPVVVRDEEPREVASASPVERIAPADGPPAVSEGEERRTVVIRGQAAPRQGVDSRRRRPPQRSRDRMVSNPDRIAMWAVGLGVLLILVAAMTAGG